MPRTGTASLPLHRGKAPRWLFMRMTALAREITCMIVSELGHDAFLEKISDPYWFQALGCVLAFDWHSSGLTTTVTGALKEGLRGIEGEVGLFIAGGKGAASRKTPEQIRKYGEEYSIDPEPLIYASRMSAKVDNTAVQDGYQLYHHVFIFTVEGKWSVIQQGMNDAEKSARRYHWLGDKVDDFVVEPHSAVCSEKKGAALNLVAAESEEARKVSTELSRERPEKVIETIRKFRELDMSRRHEITLADIDPGRLHRILLKTYEHQPEDFEGLLGIKGIGPKTIRALSLVSEIVYGSHPSYRDPARFSFAHGGKDGTPFPVDLRTYEKTIEIMKKAVQRTRIGESIRKEALRRLIKFFGI